jgi:hypothetical protein
MCPGAVITLLLLLFMLELIKRQITVGGCPIPCPPLARWVRQLSVTWDNHHKRKKGLFWLMVRSLSLQSLDPVAFGPVGSSSTSWQKCVSSYSSNGGQEVKKRWRWGHCPNFPFKATPLMTSFPPTWPHLLKVPPIPIAPQAVDLVLGDTKPKHSTSH